MLRCSVSTSCVLNPGDMTCPGLSITEPQACNYLGTFYVDCARNTYNPGTLCVDLPSPTGSITATYTPTSSLTSGATSSSSPSNTPSTSISGSNTASVSLTASSSATRSMTSSPTNTATSSVTPSATFVPQPAWLGTYFYSQSSYQVTASGYVYTFRPFRDAYQTSTAAGKVFKAFETVADATCLSGRRWNRQNFTGACYTPQCLAITIAGPRC